MNYYSKVDKLLQFFKSKVRTKVMNTTCIHDKIGHNSDHYDMFLSTEFEFAKLHSTSNKDNNNYEKYNINSTSVRSYHFKIYLPNASDTNSKWIILRVDNTIYSNKCLHFDLYWIACDSWLIDEFINTLYIRCRSWNLRCIQIPEVFVAPNLYIHPYRPQQYILLSNQYHKHHNTDISICKQEYMVKYYFECINTEWIRDHDQKTDFSTVPIFAKISQKQAEIKAELDRKANGTISTSNSTTKVSLLSTAVEQHNLSMAQQYHAIANNNHPSNNNNMYSLQRPNLTLNDTLTNDSGSDFYVGGLSSSSNQSSTPNTPNNNNNSNKNDNIANNNTMYPSSVDLNPKITTSVKPSPLLSPPERSFVFTPLGTPRSDTEVASVIPPPNLHAVDITENTLKISSPKPVISSLVHNSKRAYTSMHIPNLSHTLSLSLQAFRRNMKPTNSISNSNPNMHSISITNNNNDNNAINASLTQHLYNSSHITNISNSANTRDYSGKCLPNNMSPDLPNLPNLPTTPSTRHALQKHNNSNTINNMYTTTNKRDIQSITKQYIYRSGSVCIRFAPNGFIWVINLTNRVSDMTTSEKEKININDCYISFTRICEAVDICMDIVDDIIHTIN